MADSNPLIDDDALQFEQFSAAVAYTDNFRELMQQRTMSVGLDAEQRPIQTTPLWLDLASQPFISDTSADDLELIPPTLETLRRQHLIDEPRLPSERKKITALPTMLGTYALIAQLHAEQSSANPQALP